MVIYHRRWRPVRWGFLSFVACFGNFLFWPMGLVAVLLVWYGLSVTLRVIASTSTCLKRVFLFLILIKNFTILLMDNGHLRNSIGQLALYSIQSSGQLWSITMRSITAKAIHHPHPVPQSSHSGIRAALLQHPNYLKGNRMAN